MSGPDPTPTAEPSLPLAKWGDAALEHVCRTEIPGYDPWATALPGQRFDPGLARRAIAFFHDMLVFVEGERAGQPFDLEPWQAAIVGNLFGWIDATTGHRRYREGFVFVARKNGKTAICAGIALYLLLCDGEPGAQVYSAAAEQAQAALIFRCAMQMIARQQELLARTRVYRAFKSIEVPETGSIFRALTADAQTKHGLSVHGAVIDELHAHPTRDLVDVLQTATGARRQPLTVHITTSDHERVSICNEKYDYAKKVRERTIADASFLPVVYEANLYSHSERLSSRFALEEMERLCSCGAASINVAERWQRGGYANAAMIGGTRRTVETPGSGAGSIPTGAPEYGACAPPATNSGDSTTTRSSGKGPSNGEGFGLSATPSGLRRFKTGGAESRRTEQSSRLSGECESTGSRPSNSRTSESDREDGARSARERSTNSTSTTVISQEPYADYCVEGAIPALDFSETLRKVYAEHSPTCRVRELTAVDGIHLVVGRPGDDWADPAVWKKANPNLGVSVKEEYLARECARAKESPAYLNTFLRLHLNIRTNADVAAFDMRQWEACRGDRSFHELAVQLEGHECYAGLDLASTEDLTALVLVFPDDGNAVLPFFWCPKEGAVAREKRHRVPYLGWARDGFLELTDGNATDFDHVEKKAVELAKRYRLRSLGFDRFGAAQVVNHLKDAGIDVVLFGQGFVSMNGPSKYLDVLVRSGDLRHGGHPVLAWMASNLMWEKDAADNWKPSKKKSREKIDGLSALIMALGMGMALSGGQGPSVEDALLSGDGVLA